MKKSSVFIVCCVCFLICTLLRYPANMISASAAAIQLWLTRVFPSLFPFLVSCNILLYIGAAERMGFFLRPLTKLVFGLDGIAAFPFFCSILSGYPTGAKITASLYQKKMISLSDAEHILVFSSTPGPLFLIGTIGAGFFSMPFFGYLLLVSSFFGAVLTGVLFRFRKKNTSHINHNAIITQPDFPLFETLSLSVYDAVQTILLIGGYLIFFAAFSEALVQAGFFRFISDSIRFLPLSAKSVQGSFCGILEMTNGAYLLSQAGDPLRMRLTIVSFLVSFGGLSILGQTLGLLSAVPINKKSYLQGKFCNALFSSLFFWFFYPFWEQKAQKAVPVFFTFTETAFTLSFLWLLPSLFFIGVLIYAIIHR